MRSIVWGATVVGAARAGLVTFIMTPIVTWPSRGEVTGMTGTALLAGGTLIAGVALMSAISTIVSVAVATRMTVGGMRMAVAVATGMTMGGRRMAARASAGQVAS